MKLNFWQWLAVVLLVIGLVWWAYDWHSGKTAVPAAHEPPATQSTGSK